MPSRSEQHDYEAFAEGFGFEETPDQAAAIEAVIADMTAGKPMDRLVCGDVGFGKTEVALRAAFVAVADGKQVAILVPDDAARRAALPDLLRPLRRLAGEDRRALALPQRRRRSRRVARRPRRRRDRHRHRHAQAAPEGRQVQEPGARHHRRGAPLRRAPEGGAEEAARRGRRAHAHRDADPAHARDVARGHPRLLGDRHRAAAAPRDQDVRRAAGPKASSARRCCAS